MRSMQKMADSPGSILSVIDFSEPSIESLKWAAQLASDRRSHLTVLYPYRLNQLEKNGHSSSQKKDIDNEAHAIFNQLARPFLSESLITYDFRSEVGFIYDRVYSHTMKINTQFIVISQKLASANRDSLYDLIDTINVPLVIVPTTKTK